MSPNTMTLDECRDWLAERAGFRQLDSGLWSDASINSSRMFKHPVPPTLDALDRLRPGQWHITMGQFCHEPYAWYAYARRHGETGYPHTETDDPDAAEPLYPHVTAPDRLTCEARLCVAMWVAEGEGKG